MRCPQCHAKISEESKFCPFCGERLTIYQASQEKYEMENDQQYYYDRETQKALDEAMEKEMIAPLTEEKRKKKKNVIVISFLVIVGVVGAVYFLKHTFRDNNSKFLLTNTINKKEATAITTNFVSAEYHQEGIALLEQMTSQAMNERALSVGGQAFVAEISNYANELDIFYQKATTAEEREFARAVENVCLFSLSIMGEKASVAEAGGRNDAQAEVVLEQRIAQVNDWKKRLQEATTSEEIIAINKEIEKT